jgi:DNA-binding transcriptional regulator YiaG
MLNAAKHPTEVKPHERPTHREYLIVTTEEREEMTKYKKYVVRLNVGPSNKTRTQKEWVYDNVVEANALAAKLAYIGDAQQDRAIISPQEIAELRAKLGLSMRDFAAHVGAKNQATVFAWEKGDDTPRPAMQRKLLDLCAERK